MTHSVRYHSPEFFARVARGLGTSEDAPDLVVHLHLDGAASPSSEQHFGRHRLLRWLPQPTRAADLVVHRSTQLDHADHAGLAPLGEVLVGTSVVLGDGRRSADLLGIELLAREAGHPCIGTSVIAAFEVGSSLGNTTLHLRVQGGLLRSWAIDPARSEPTPDFELRCSLDRFLCWLHDRHQLGWLLLPGEFRGDVEVSSYLEGATDWSSPAPTIAAYLRAREASVDQIDALVETTRS